MHIYWPVASSSFLCHFILVVQFRFQHHSDKIPVQRSCTYCTFTGQWPPLDTSSRQALSLEILLVANVSKRWQDQNHCFLPGHDLAYIAHFLASSRRKTRQQCCLSLGKHPWVPTGASNSNNSLLNWVCSNMFLFLGKFKSNSCLKNRSHAWIHVLHSDE